MTASSTPVRIHLWIRPVGASRLNPGAAYLPAGSADEFHTTRVPMRSASHRSLLRAAPLCVLNGMLLRSSGSVPRMRAGYGTPHPPWHRARRSGTKTGLPASTGVREFSGLAWPVLLSCNRKTSLYPGPDRTDPAHSLYNAARRAGAVRM